MAARGSGRSAAAASGAGSATIPELDLIFYGTGNPGAWNPDQRPGDNIGRRRSSRAIPAPARRSGPTRCTPARRVGLRRHQRAHPVDLADRRPAAQGAAAVPTATGIVYLLDRVTGELISRRPFVHDQLGQGRRPADRPADRGRRSKRTHQGVNVTATSAPRRPGPRTGSPSAFSLAHRACSTCPAHESVHGLRRPSRPNYIAGTPYVGAKSRCTPARAAIAASSSPGIRWRARRCGRSRKSSRSGAARW